MTHLFSKRWTIRLLVLTLLLVSLACKFLASGSATDTPLTGTPTPEALTVEGDFVFGPGDFILPETKAGLADLISYKATLILSFDGTRAGKTAQWSKTYVMLTTKEPAAMQLTIEKTGDLSDLDPVFMAEMNGTDYERLGENACNANVIEEGNSLGEWLEPAGFLTGVHGAEVAGAETVNDVASDKYTFDERAFGQLDIAQSTGEMWVAADGGYIVKYLVTTEGNADYFGEGIEGTLTFDYELTDVNGLLTFELPADCPAGVVNAPQLSDASNVLNMPGVLSYDTSSSLADAVAFYQEQIPSLGWEPLSEPTIGETMALMDFMQSNQIMTVIIIVGDTGTNVQIVLSKAQE